MTCRLGGIVAAVVVLDVPVALRPLRVPSTAVEGSAGMAKSTVSVQCVKSKDYSESRAG